MHACTPPRHAPLPLPQNKSSHIRCVQDATNREPNRNPFLALAYTTARRCTISYDTSSPPPHLNRGVRSVLFGSTSTPQAVITQRPSLPSDILNPSLSTPLSSPLLTVRLQPHRGVFHPSFPLKKWSAFDTLCIHTPLHTSNLQIVSTASPPFLASHSLKSQIIQSSCL
jgi:hypothetical protein